MQSQRKTRPDWLAGGVRSRQRRSAENPPDEQSSEGRERRLLVIREPAVRPQTDGVQHRTDRDVVPAFTDSRAATQPAGVHGPLTIGWSPFTSDVRSVACCLGCLASYSGWVGSAREHARPPLF